MLTVAQRKFLDRLSELSTIRTHEIISEFRDLFNLSGEDAGRLIGQWAAAR